MPDSVSNPTPRRSGRSLLYVALGLFAIGLVAIIAVFVVPLVSDARPGVWLYLIAMAATSLGLLLGIVFALWSGRRAR
ncbi:hypothetical protein [Nocardia pseudobrasiliensis]|uniref:Uncharacterized protein n=1 Tax=Nocardia pseudobrasiliensis TaxID=45979 RepID=A0A370HSE9_9NOCA|nr:hypothetical protein [Nocardia pseudobrasiliensis]RDI61438.1 hypothetical protein DFR76_114163 [Nocardia pseudobrasiliensis]